MVAVGARFDMTRAPRPRPRCWVKSVPRRPCLPNFTAVPHQIPPGLPAGPPGTLYRGPPSTQGDDGEHEARAVDREPARQDEPGAEDWTVCGGRHVGHGDHQRPARGHHPLSRERHPALWLHPDVQVLQRREGEEAGAGAGLRAVAAEAGQRRPATLGQPRALRRHAERAARPGRPARSRHPAPHDHRPGGRHQP